MRGRPPKSNEQHKADGTYRADRHKPAPRQALKALPTAPARLTTKTAKDAWKRFGGALVRMKILTEGELGPLEQLAEAYSEWRESLEAIKRDGRYFPSEDGPPTRHPAIADAARLYATMLALQQQLGLTPGSRQRLRVEPSGGEVDELDDFIAGGKGK